MITQSRRVSGLAEAESLLVSVEDAEEDRMYPLVRINIVKRSAELSARLYYISVFIQRSCRDRAHWKRLFGGGVLRF